MSNTAEIIGRLREENETLRRFLANITDEDADWRLPDCPPLPLTPLTRKVLRVLYKKYNKTVRHAALYELLYSMRPEAKQPTAETVPALISKIRLWLRGTNWRIDTMCTVGWKLTRIDSSRQKRVEKPETPRLRGN